MESCSSEVLFQDLAYMSRATHPSIGLGLKRRRSLYPGQEQPSIFESKAAINEQVPGHQHPLQKHVLAQTDASNPCAANAL